MARTDFWKLAFCGLLACGSDSAPSSDRADEAHLRVAVAAYDSAWQAKDSAPRSATSVVGLHLFHLNRGSDLAGENPRVPNGPDLSSYSGRSSEIGIAIAGPVARVTSRWEGRGEYQGRPVLDDQTCGQMGVARRSLAAVHGALCESA